MRQTSPESAAASSTDLGRQQDGVSTCRHKTPIGPMRSCWTEAGLHSLTWVAPEPLLTAEANTERADLHPADCEQADSLLMNSQWPHPQVQAERHSPPAAELLEDRLSEYFQSGHADFGSIGLDDRDWTPFTRSVYECCREIAPGTTLTYQQLAHRAGNASASRAVGAAMARNRVLLVIPCHRVVSRGGNLRGFSGPGGIQTKQFLLDLEAV